MKIGVISAIYMVFVVIQMTQCVAVLGTKDEITDKKDLALGLKGIIDPTQNDGTILVRQKRGSCCGGGNTDCCCKVNGLECKVRGGGYQCHWIHGGSWDCEGCRFGWKC